MIKHLKELKDQAAFLSERPAPFEAVVLLDHDMENGLHSILYQGDMQTAERVMTCWNTWLGVDIRQVRRPFGGRFQ